MEEDEIKRKFDELDRGKDEEKQARTKVNAIIFGIFLFIVIMAIGLWVLFGF